MLNFVSWGSGSSGNCYFLYTENEGLLIDAGVGVRTIKKYFREYGLKLSQINNILITHDHADHVKAVGALSIETGAKVWSTKSVHIGIMKNFCVRKKVPEDNISIIETGSTFSIGSFTIHSCHVPHDSMDNNGYLIKYENVSLGLITDIGSVTQDIANIVANANYLVIEANHDINLLLSGKYPQRLKERILSSHGHLSNKDCGQLLATYGTVDLRRVWLCHLSEDNNQPEIALSDIKESIADTVFYKNPSFKIETLERKRPTGVFELK